MAHIAPPVDGILAIVRAAGAEDALPNLLQLGRAHVGTDLWDRLAQAPVTPATDLRAARAWLERELTDPAVTGAYLGLDTLNMEQRGPEYAPPQNVEIGLNLSADPEKLEMEWAWECDRYGSGHLINGLRTLARAYDGARPDYRSEVVAAAEYILFLGYSGVVLKQALATAQLPRRSQALLAVWGFHDGDLYYLGRRSPAGFEPIASL